MWRYNTKEFFLVIWVSSYSVEIPWGKSLTRLSHSFIGHRMAGEKEETRVIIHQTMKRHLGRLHHIPHLPNAAHSMCYSRVRNRDKAETVGDSAISAHAQLRLQVRRAHQSIVAPPSLYPSLRNILLCYFFKAWPQCTILAFASLTWSHTFQQVTYMCCNK